MSEENAEQLKQHVSRLQVTLINAGIILITLGVVGCLTGLSGNGIDTGAEAFLVAVGITIILLGAALIYIGKDK